MTDHDDGTLVGAIQKRVNEQLARAAKGEAAKPGLPKVYRPSARPSKKQGGSGEREPLYITRAEWEKKHGVNQPQPTTIEPPADSVIDVPIVAPSPTPPAPHELILPPGVSPFTVSVELPRTKLKTRELKVLAKTKPVPAEHADVIGRFKQARRLAKAVYNQTLAAGGKADIDLSGKVRNRRGLRCFVVKQWELGKVERPARKRLTFAQAYPTISGGQQGPAQERASAGRKGKRHG